MSAARVTTTASPFLFVAGTRPEAIKLAPLIMALQARGCAVRLVATGQQPVLFHDTLAAFGLVADEDLGVTAATPAELLGRLQPPLSARVPGARALVVQGDTTSALAGALAGAYAGVPVVHVEAGLRTGSRDPHPEELHRSLIGRIADLHFAPTPAAVAALAREGVAGSRVVMTGNSGIDALLWMQARIDGRAMQARFAGVDFRRPVLLVTVHRRENHGAALAGVVEAVAALSAEAEIVLPVHPHPAVSGPVCGGLAGLAGVHLLPPLDYPAFVWLMGRATLALTDSGGVQEEAPALGLPVLVMRGATERPEGLASGNARMVGTQASAIVAAVRGLLEGDGLAAMAEPALPYGAGDASGRMADALVARYGGDGIACPTQTKLVINAE
jgi:UDP-N-acetylglucosamine 2-epimerase (non-hydrolysing)